MAQATGVTVRVLLFLGLAAGLFVVAETFTVLDPFVEAIVVDLGEVVAEVVEALLGAVVVFGLHR
ncbi:hypothetical protein ACL03H_02725 [Saccharopolyspora sp. MS10]|uniref:hypothetical protein n=1 Tax=Saccharopolyspora sp. MS10 TaxID=3385973 RepID=UPI0039A0A11C